MCVAYGSRRPRAACTARSARRAARTRPACTRAPSTRRTRRRRARRDELRHARDLVRRRRTILAADDDVANRAEPDHRRDVHRRLQRARARPQVGKRANCGRLAVASAPRRGARDEPSCPTTIVVMPWRTSDSARGSVPERAVAVRVDVDEARRHGQAARVDLDRAVIARRFLPTATMRPPAMTTSSSPGAPSPSKTVPPRMTSA